MLASFQCSSLEYPALFLKALVISTLGYVLSGEPSYKYTNPTGVRHPSLDIRPVSYTAHRNSPKKKRWHHHYGSWIHRARPAIQPRSLSSHRSELGSLGSSSKVLQQPHSLIAAAVLPASPPPLLPPGAVKLGLAKLAVHLVVRAAQPLAKLVPAANPGRVAAQVALEVFSAHPARVQL